MAYVEYISYKNHSEDRVYKNTPVHVTVIHSITDLSQATLRPPPTPLPRYDTQRLHSAHTEMIVVFTVAAVLI